MSNADLPYFQAARDYLEAGWSPIPLPFKEKSPPPDDLTGAAGEWVDAVRVAAWTRTVRPVRARAGNLSFIAGNVGLRLPRNVLGIDVDLYDGKTGAKTMHDAIERMGTLPPTWSSTARFDGSGIFLFRVPEGLAWPGQVGPGVETIRWDHRYAMVAPSIHDKIHKPYAWTRPDGERVTDEIPAVAELPYLPEPWVLGLTGGAEWVEREGGDISADEARAWITDRVTPETMCEVMSATLTKYSRELRQAGEDGGAHEVARNGAWALIGDAAGGHGGVSDALNRLRKVFLAGVRERRDPDAARGEWARIVIRGIGKAAAEGTPDKEDMCALFGATESGETPKEKSSGRTGAFDFSRDDIGNAQRLVSAVGSDARYVPAYGAWAVYSPSSSLWELDRDRDAPITRAMMKVVRGMESEAAFIEDPKAAAAFLAHVKASGGIGRIKAAIELASSMKGMSLPAEAFDAEPSVLVCANGVLELNGDGVGWRALRHADYATYSTGVEYVASAHSELWEGFLGRILPDSADRTWVQTLVGYSLFGANQERILVIAKGPTTSGKGTFVEAIRLACGPYASMFNLSLLREKQDEAPRNDVVEALPRRIVFASEASAEWFLHADAVKRFTGGDPIRARRLNSNVFVERVPAFTPWLATNSYPQIPGADKALWRRLKTAPFLESLSEDEVDVTMKARLCSPRVRPAVLAWAVRGWELYCASGLREPSRNALELLFEARNEMSDLDMFLAEACDFAAEYTEEARRLFDAYRSWAENAGLTGKSLLSIVGFGRALSGKGFERATVWVGSAEGKAVKVRTGLQLKGEWARFS